MNGDNEGHYLLNGTPKRSSSSKSIGFVRIRRPFLIAEIWSFDKKQVILKFDAAKSEIFPLAC